MACCLALSSRVASALCFVCTCCSREATTWRASKVRRFLFGVEGLFGAFELLFARGGGGLLAGEEVFARGEALLLGFEAVLRLKLLLGEMSE